MQKESSVIRNTALSYAGQAYALLVGILIMPFYLSHLGAEAYGLIGFFAVMQAWLQLLDAGLSPSLVRAPSAADRRRPNRPAALEGSPLQCVDPEPVGETPAPRGRGGSGQQDGAHRLGRDGAGAELSAGGPGIGAESRLTL